MGNRIVTSTSSLWLLGLLSCFALGFLVDKNIERATIIRGSRLELVDSGGKKRVVIDGDAESGVSLSLNSTDESPVVSASVGNDGSSEIYLGAQASDDSIVLRVCADGSKEIFIANPDHSAKVTISLRESEGASIELRDDRLGSVRVQVHDSFLPSCVPPASEVSGMDPFLTGVVVRDRSYERRVELGSRHSKSVLRLND